MTFNAFNFGILFKVKEWKNFTFKTGLHFGGYGFKYPLLTDIRWPSEITPQGWMPDPNSPREGQLSISYYFLEIPLLLAYHLRIGKWAPYVGVTVSPQYLIGSYSVVNDPNFISRSVNLTATSKIFNTMLTGQIGTYYHLSDVLAIFANAESGIQLFNNTSTPIRERFYGSRINLGVAFNLNLKK